MTVSEAKMADVDGDEPRRAAPGSTTIPGELVDGLMAKVAAEGLELLGEGGVLAELTKTILEGALSAPQRPEGTSRGSHGYSSSRQRRLHHRAPAVAGAGTAAPRRGCAHRS